METRRPAPDDSVSSCSAAISLPNVWMNSIIREHTTTANELYQTPGRGSPGSDTCLLPIGWTYFP